MFLLCYTVDLCPQGAEATAADSDGGGARGAGLSHAHVTPPLHPLQAHTRQVFPFKVMLFQRANVGRLS